MLNRRKFFGCLPAGVAGWFGVPVPVQAKCDPLPRPGEDFAKRLLPFKDELVKNWDCRTEWQKVGKVCVGETKLRIKVVNGCGPMSLVRLLRALTPSARVDCGKLGPCHMIPTAVADHSAGVIKVTATLVSENA